MSEQQQASRAKSFSWRAQAVQLAAIVAVVFVAKGAVLIGNGPTDLHRITMPSSSAPMPRAPS